jgi:hydrogenase nickel incorporation protein HypA/HybF
MHELAIAEGVVEVALRHARGRPVAVVELKVGHLRQVVPSALEFAFELVSEGTPLEGAELRMEEVPAAGRCRSCGTDTPLPELPLRCRACGGWDVEVTRGEELLVDALELDGEQDRSAAGNARCLHTTLASGG